MGSRIKALSEIALRVGDLDAMARFYSDVVVLEVIRRSDSSVFLRVGDGVDGLTQMLVLFAASVEPYSVRQPLAEPRAEASTLHHLALAITSDDLAPERERLERLGCTVTEASHPWAQSRSLYVNDPEGNVVEWVCVDRSL
jgi:catechol-2,3-dioxygenase